MRLNTSYFTGNLKNNTLKNNTLTGIILIMGEVIAKLSSNLFWDVDKEQVNPEIHSRWLIERVLQRGFWEDWLLIRDYYGKERLNKLRPSLKLDKKAANFLALYCRP